MIVKHSQNKDGKYFEDHYKNGSKVAVVLKNRWNEPISGFSKWPSGEWHPFEGFAPHELKPKQAGGI